MTGAARAWAEALASWAIPPEILDAAPRDPWSYPVSLFVRAAEEAMGRDSLSYRRAVGALPVGGTVLDVGCGAGAASLPLVPPAARLAGVDESAEMLAAFAERAGTLGAAHAEVRGRWPDVSSEVDPADVVVCHHVLYNVADLAPFVRALTDRARRRVVVEITAGHPRAWLNPLWRALHRIERPERPTADDAAAVIAEAGVAARVEHWDRPLPRSAAHDEELVAMARVALCLPEERDPDVARALAEHPPPERRALATIWWDVA